MQKLKWQYQQGEISLQGFMDLFANQCGYLVIPNFLTIQECDRLVTTLRALGLKKYDYNFDETQAPPAGHLFTTHYLYENKSAEEYFPQAAESNELYNKLVQQAGVNPVKKLLDLLTLHLQTPVTIAQQNGQKYSCVIARELNHSALLHADFAGFIPPSWSIAKVIAQYAWNIYLSDPGQGGETIVYNKPWELTDDQYILGETYGYDHRVVKHAESIKFRPQIGSLMLFNSRNFHEVEKCSQPRLTLGGHVGLTDKNEVLLWV